MFKAQGESVVAHLATHALRDPDDSAAGDLRGLSGVVGSLETRGYRFNAEAFERVG